ncbi:hypothetical protein LJC38_03800 [Parabacteroides sp. OttesenSCG-928-K15]|nr:hypothetical protein [Parabacteroides sp. OttesenSCG-928-K15]
MKQQMKAAQTPLEQLRKKKEQIKLETERQVTKLNSDLEYLHDNAGKLILSSATSALFPGKSKRNTSSGQHSAITDLALNGATGILNNNGIFSAAFKMAQPFLLTWGLKGVKKLIGSLFFRKKKKRI